MTSRSPEWEAQMERKADALDRNKETSDATKDAIRGNQHAEAERVIAALPRPVGRPGNREPPVGKRRAVPAPYRLTNTQRAALDALYAELPTIDCLGNCWGSCGPIAMSAAERQRIRADHGVDIAPTGDGVCVALTRFHRCAVREARPMICRLWGMTAGMRCDSGCVPSRWLSEAEAYEYLARAEEISGNHAEAARMRAGWDTPERAEQSQRLLYDMLQQTRVEETMQRGRLTRAVQTGGHGVFAVGRGALSKTPPGQSGERR